MALEVGGVFARLGTRFDDSGFDKFDRRMDRAEARARRGIHTAVDVDVDRANRGFRDYERAVDRADHANTNMVRGSGRLRGAMGSLFVGGAGVAGATIAFGLLAKGAKSAFDAFQEGEVIAARTRNVIATTGGAANVTARDVETLATSLSRKAGVDDELIKSGENVLLTFTKVRNEAGKGNAVFDRGTKAALDMSRALGTDLQGANIQLGKALNDPIKGITSLGRAGVSFTAQQKEQIKALVEAGDLLGAQKIILSEVESEFGGAAESMATNSGKLSVTLGNLQETVGGWLAPAFDKATGAANRFVEEMQSGEGSGGRFAEVARQVADGAGAVIGGLVDAGRGVVEFIAGNEDAQRTVGRLGDLFGDVKDAVVEVAGGIADAFRGVQPELETIGRAILKVQSVLMDLYTSTVRRALPGIVTAIKGLANVVRGVVQVIAGILSGDFGKAWDGVKRIVEGALDVVLGLVRAATAPFREAFSRVFGGIGSIASAAWRGVTGAVRGGVDVIAGGASSLLGILADVAGAAAKLPIVGGKFRGLAADIRAAQRGIDGYRESLRDTSPEQKRAEDRVAKYAGEVSIARQRLATLKRGTDVYRDAAKDLREKQRRLNDAMGDAQAAGTKGARGIGKLGDAAGSTSDAVAGAAETIAANVNNLAESLGAKGIKFKVARTKRGRERQANVLSPELPDFRDAFASPRQRGGRFAGGGFIGGRGMVSDDVVPLGLDAIAAFGEAVLTGPSGDRAVANRHQIPVIENALAIARQVAPEVVPYGDLDELFGGITTRHMDGFQRGGRRRGYQRGGIVPVPGSPGEFANASVVPVIRAILRMFPGLTLTDAYGQGHNSPGHTVTGTAADFSGPDRVMDAAVRYLVGKGYLVGYDGRFGSQAWPDHGPSTVTPNYHLHAELGGRGGAGGVLAPRLPGVTIDGPAGALLGLGQRAASRMQGAGQSFLDRAAARLGVPVGGGGGGRGGGKLGLQALVSLARRFGMPPIMGGVAWNESDGNVNAYNPSSATGLWQVLANLHTGLARRFNLRTADGNARAAKILFSESGLAPWEESRNQGAHGGWGRLVGRLARGGRQAFARGGRNKTPRKNTKAAKAAKARTEAVGKMARGQVGGGTTSGYLLAGTRPLQRMQHDQVGEYDDWTTAIDRLEFDYGIAERRFDRTEEEPLNDDGSINVEAIQRRAAELLQLGQIRAQIRDYYEKARATAQRVARSYRELIKRYSTALRYARKKDRGAIRQEIARLRELVPQWQGNAEDARQNAITSNEDWLDLGLERSSLIGTTARPPETDTATDFGGRELEDLDVDRELGDLDYAGASETARPPSPLEIAEAAAGQLRSFQSARADLFGSSGANFMRAGGLSAVIGEAAQAAGLRYLGGSTGGTDGGVLAGAGGGRTININGPLMAVTTPAIEPHTTTQSILTELDAAAG